MYVRRCPKDKIVSRDPLGCKWKCIDQFTLGKTNIWNYFPSKSMQLLCMQRTLCMLLLVQACRYVVEVIFMKYAEVLFFSLCDVYILEMDSYR